MTLMTIPREKPGIRYEIPAHNPDEGILTPLGGLIDFLGQVRGTARLRAKEDGHVKFLHTRTGTPFGRLWKWLTIWTPEAVSQRKQARELIEAIIRNIAGRNRFIRELKEQILTETLAVKRFEEFDIQKLRKELEKLKELTTSPVVPDTTEVAAETATTTAPSSPVKLPSSETTAMATDAAQPHAPPIASGPQPPASAPELPRLDVKALDELDALLSVPLELPEKADKTPAPPALTTEQKQLIEDLEDAIDQPLLMPTTEAELVLPMPDTAPAEDIPSSPASTTTPIAAQAPQSYIVEPLRQGQRGLLEIEQAFAISQTGMMNRYEADAYVLPASMRLQFDVGSLALQRHSDSNGILVEEGTHHTPQRTRQTHALFRITLDPPAPALQGSARDIGLRDFYRQLFQTLSALKDAPGNRVQNMAIAPVKQRILTDTEAQIFINAASDFQQAHPDVRLLVVATGQAEARRLQTARQQWDSRAADAALRT